MGEQKRTPTPSESIEDNNEMEELNEDDIVEVIDLDEEGAFDEDEDMEEGEEEKRHFNVDSDDSICTLRGHRGSVFCCDVNRTDQNLVVTGGEDDLAYLWKIDENVIEMKLEGFKDSVSAVAFSHDGVYVAAGDMGGKIQVFKVSEKKLVWDFEIADLNWLAWHSAAHVLFAGDVSGSFWMWQIPSGNCKTYQGADDPNECGKLLHDGKRIVCGYGNGSLRLWDLKSGNAVHSWTGANGHLSTVTSIDVKADDALIISGGTDGAAKLYNVATGKVLSTFICSTEGVEEGSPQSVESVSFAPPALGLQLAATGTLKGDISLWDLPTQVERCRVSQTDGIVRLAWAPDQPLIHSVSLDGVVATIDARTGSIVRKQIGHTSNILDMSLSANGSFMVTTSDDSTAKVFKLQ